jgi:endonuclease/exonuclease/phosphatase family metal-dependent hydrolase
MLKLMTLNLYRYEDWDAREPAIAKLITEEAPDFIAFQEVLTNPAFSSRPQSDLIADVCNYKYRAFAPTLLRTNARDKDGVRSQQASEGQACISRHPIISTETYFLKQHPDYPEDVSVQFCSIEVKGQVVQLCNVHFANNHIAYKHLDELLELIESRGDAPIILGDFNIYKLAAYKEKNRLLKNYQLSSEVSDYISFEADGDSLDYIAARGSKYQIDNVTCSDQYVSDHKALLADVQFSTK